MADFGKNNLLGLVDCNNFYASCERVFFPALRGAPVVVLSNNDGCVIARSDEARALVPMGAPAFKYRQVFARHGIHALSSNFALYGDMSRRVMTLLAARVPALEVYSIDEAFIDLRGIANAADAARAIRSEVLAGTHIPTCIGLAPNKTLAKAANRIAKKHKTQTGGVYAIDTPAKREKALRWLQCEDVWGIGRRMSAKLAAGGIRTAHQFAQLPDDIIQRRFSIAGVRTARELRGEILLPLAPPQPRQSLATTRSFADDISDLSALRERVSVFATLCARKLRRENIACNQLLVFLSTNRHKPGAHHSASRKTTVHLLHPSNSDLTLSAHARAALERLYQPGIAYKKAGVLAFNITPAHAAQINMFDAADPRHAPLMQAMDTLNRRFGERRVRLAAQDPDKWKMRQANRSPRYTTCLAEILQVS